MKLIEEVLDAPTYYPEKERKSREERRKDLLDWRKEHLEVNEYYNIYGLDIKGSDPSLYNDYWIAFRADRDRMNRSGEHGSAIGVMEDKFMFYRIGTAMGLPIPKVFAYVNRGVFFDVNMERIEMESLQNRKDYFLKDAYGMKGKSVWHIKDYDDLLARTAELNESDYILQERIVASPEAARLYSGCINTIRIITVRPIGEEPRIFAKFQRMGSEKTGRVDNWSSGGVAVGIKDDGYLKNTGFYKYDTPGGCTDRHPDSGTVFSSYRIPMYEEVLELAIRAHKCFSSLFSCGWDIAVTEDGPVLVEGNDNWAGGSPQVCDRPLRKEWDALVREYDQRCTEHQNT
ncbi:MAG: hypothetical protein K6B44_13260 [Lachnospiraceae bacterium]|nr:hypothetical protein [Lachnospiraceae bacterium]